MSPLEELRRAYPDVEWGVATPADRDVAVLVGTRFGQRARREIPTRVHDDWWQVLAAPVRSILEELGLVGPAAREEHPAAALHRPVHGGYCDGRLRDYWRPGAVDAFHEPGAQTALAGAVALEWEGPAYMQTQRLDVPEMASQLAEAGWRLVRA